MPNLYVDLSYQANSNDQSRSYVKTSGGPNGYWAWTDDSGMIGGYRSQYYQYFQPNGNYSNTVEYEANAKLITPVVPEGIRQATGINLSYQASPYTDAGVFQQPKLFGGTGIKGLQIVAMPSNVSGFSAPQKYSDAGYSASIQYLNYGSDNGLTSFDLKQSSEWLAIDSSNIWVQTAGYAPDTNYGYNFADQYPDSTIQVRVVTNPTLGQSALQIRFGSQSENSFTERSLSGAEWAAVFERFKVVDTNEVTPHQADYAFKVQITDGAMSGPAINAPQWVGNANKATNADTVYVSYDSLAPTASALYVAGNAIVLAMNGTGSSNFANNVAESEWQPVSDSALISTFTLNYQLSGAAPVKVNVISVESGWGAYRLETASLIPANAKVTLTYTPPAGTTGIDQISGVIQDMAMNDAKGFSLTGTSESETGVTLDATTFTMGVNNLGGLDFDSAKTFKVTNLLDKNKKSTGVFTVDATFADNSVAQLTFTLKSGQKVVNVTLNTQTAWSDWIDANFGKFDSLVKRQMTVDKVIATETVSKIAGKAWLDDTLEGVEYSWNDILKGGVGADRLSGLSGSDSLLGNAGNDVLDGGSGNDYLNGGADNDSIYGGTGNDSLLGDAGNDYLDGGSGNDLLDGGAGDDILYGSHGDDRLVGGAGTNTLDGGEGFDIADYSALATAVNVDLTRTSKQVTSNGISDTLLGVEKIIGSKMVDTMVGDNGDNIFDGGAEIDKMSGGYGNDRYYVDSSAEANFIKEEVGDFGQETGNMGGGNDHIIASASVTLTTESGIEDIYAAGVFNGATSDTAINLKGNNQGQGLIGNEAVNILQGGTGDDGLFGYGGNDTLLGGDGDDWLVGGLGNDLMNGEGGNDVIFGYVNGPVTGNNNFKGEVFDFYATGGVDTIDGGEGSDLLVLHGQKSDYLFKQAHDDWYKALHSETGTEIQFRNIENLSFGAVGRDSGNDSLDLSGRTSVGVDSLNIQNYVRGTDEKNVQEGTGEIDLIFGMGGDDIQTGYGGNDTLYGGDGNDSLDGGVGEDLLFGGAGNDVLDGGVGDDLMEGGAGDDTYKVDSFADTVIELANKGVDTVEWTMAAGGETSFVVPEYVENLTAKSAGVLVGNSANNVITGSAFGNTFIVEGDMDGVAGDDTLKGGAGNDTYIIDMSARGNVTINDAGGTDTIQFVNEIGSYTTAVADETAKTVTITSYADESQKQALKTITIQNATGTNAGNIEVFNNVLGHNLKLGDDPSAPFAPDSEIDGTLKLGTSGNDNFTVATGNDVFIGGNGNDTFNAGIGLDVFDGGLGADYVTYNDIKDTSNPDGTSRVNGIFVRAIFDHETPENTNQTYLVYKGSVEGIDLQNGLVNFDSITNATWEDASGLPPAVEALVSIEAIRGTRFNDTMIGSAAGDYFAGNGGDNYINGGNGRDWADYKGATDGVSVDLGVGQVSAGLLATSGGETPDIGSDVVSSLVSTGRLQQYFDSNGALFGTASGWGGTDILVDIENIRGTEFNDTLVGSSAGNVLRGGEGDDVINGGFSALPGWMSSYNIDWSDYSQATGKVFADLGIGTATGADGNDTLIGINGVRGSAFADTLVGGSDSASEWFTGGAGDDIIVGGSGTDVATYQWASGAVSVTLGVIASKPSTSVAGISVVGMSYGTSAGADGVDALYGVEAIVGSQYSDTLVGDDGDNLFRPLAGADTVDGGAGSDTIDYREALGIVNRVTEGLDTSAPGYQAGDLVRAPGVVVNLSGPKDSNGYISVRTADGNETSLTASVDKIKNIENIIGSMYDDTLVGDSGINHFSGMAGDDTFIGVGGNDVVSYQRSLGGVVLRLDTGLDASMIIDPTVSSALGVNVDGLQYGVAASADGNDLLIGIANIRGSEFNDDITGSYYQVETFDGGSGDDGLAGNGNDKLSYLSANGYVSINLASYSATGAAGNDYIYGFSTVYGSNYGNYMFGDSFDNTMIGGLGNDTFDGGAGNDLFRGVAGTDSYTGGDGVDTVAFAGKFSDYTLSINAPSGVNPGAVTVTSIATGVAYQVGRVNGDVEFISFDGNPGMVVDTMLSLSKGTAILVREGDMPGQVTPIDDLNITGTDENDFLVGSSVTGQTIQGGAGHDVLDSGTGRDTLIGGAGNDTYVVHKGDKVIEAANQGVDKVVADYSYVLGTNLENLTLQSTVANTYGMLGLGNNQDNVISGANGVNNKLYGRDGNDTISGGNRWDQISGGNGNDLIYGSSQWTVQNDRVVFDSDPMQVSGDLLLGGLDNDTIYGDNGSDLLDGGIGKDTLFGGQGDDTYNITDKDAILVEYADEGEDMVVSSLATYTLASHLENLSIASGVNGGGVGNSLNNRMAGNFYNNTLDGGDGNDALAGDGPMWYVGSTFDPNIQGGNDLLVGGNGQDSLAGQFGDDILIGGRLTYDSKGSALKDSSGNYVVTADANSIVVDYMFGGAGDDIYYVSSDLDMAWDVNLYVDNQSPNGVAVDSLTDAGGTDWIYGSIDIDLSDLWSYVFIENVKLLDYATIDTNSNYLGVQGSNGVNQLVGSIFDNFMHGFAGNDTILGGGGNDVVTGGLGDDYIDGGANAAGKEMNFVMYGDVNYANPKGDGRYWGWSEDIYAFNLKNPTFAPTESVAQLGIQLNLDKTEILGVAAGRAVGIAGTDTLLNIQGAIGSDFNDILIGNESENWLGGGRGNDTLIGGAGSDVLILGLNSAYGLTINMTDAGLTNLSSASTQSTAKVLDLSSLSNESYEGSYRGENGLGVLTYWGFEGIGASELKDTVIGSDGNDTIFGLGGNDSIDGGAGNDMLYGNTSVTSGILAGDRLNTSDDADVIHGGSGNDQIWAGVGVGRLFGDSGKDTLNGGNANDYLNGGIGDDVLNGGAGDDTLLGGGGNDVLVGGVGNDLYVYTGLETITENAAEGVDMVFVKNTSSYTLGVGLENAALEPIGSIFGSGINGATNSPTTLTGNSLDNLLLGNDGDNTLIGGDGNDTLFGLTGDDVLTGGKGNDVFGLGGNESASGSSGNDAYSANFGGSITDFNKEGTDKLLLNFIEGYHYKLSVGGNETYLNGANDQTQGPEATITYDPTSGLLQLEFQRLADWGSSDRWVYGEDSEVATGNANLTYFVMNGNNVADVNENSFLIDTTIQPVHPGLQLAYPQA